MKVSAAMKVGIEHAWALGPLLLALLWCGGGQAHGKATPKAESPAKAAAKQTRSGGKSPVRAKKRSKGSTPAGTRCRDIFCTAEVVRMDGSTDGVRRLTPQDVEQVMAASQSQLELCLVDARRRDPQVVQARIEFVIDQRGRVLASRTNGQRQNPLARCIDHKLRPVRFPRVQPPRTVAEFTLGIPQ